MNACYCLPLLTFALLASARAEEDAAPRQASGIYPSLTSYNNKEDGKLMGECGIGAVVPWAGKLWWLTYPPHEPRGSADKLYSIDEKQAMTIHPESVGGTHASRMIHDESKQLIIGPYFISEDGKIRVCDVKAKLVGRLTAVMRHLTDPANKVYFFEMEGAVYEVDVHSLDVKLLFKKPVPGWHGKGGYTAQGRVVISNNGEHLVAGTKTEFLAPLPLKSEEDAGVLAEWDGQEWRIVERKQFTEVTGPGGIHGNKNAGDPLWATGWDKRSVILKLLDGGKWHTFRLPKGSHTFDPRHGWYTEWPRIRETVPGKWLMVMHGQMFDFPQGFRAGKTGGIRPINTHLRYVPDVSAWQGKVVLASDDVSVMQNPLAGQSQSNLWFGAWEDLAKFGPASGWGGVWLNDQVKAGQPSDPFFVAGYQQRVLHISHKADKPVTYTIEADATGSGEWQPAYRITVAPNAYAHHIFPADFQAEWVRLTPDTDDTVSAYFHVANPSSAAVPDAVLFAGLAQRDQSAIPALFRPGGKTRNLQVFVPAHGGQPESYFEVSETLVPAAAEPSDDAKAIRPRLEVKADIAADAASLIITDAGGAKWRLPRFDDAWQPGEQRGMREIASERGAANWGGIFYELPRGEGADKGGVNYRKLKPVASHNFAISDYCTWRGLLVLGSARVGAKPDGHTFVSADGQCALWFGSIDDLWKLGKARGHGGPWLNTPVEANAPSDPYLMTNFDRKTLRLSHNAAQPVSMTVEVDFSNTGTWRPYQTVGVPAGKDGLIHEFPAGYNAHWLRVTSKAVCEATAQLNYE